MEPFVQFLKKPKKRKATRELWIRRVLFKPLQFRASIRSVELEMETTQTIKTKKEKSQSSQDLHLKKKGTTATNKTNHMSGQAAIHLTP